MREKASTDPKLFFLSLLSAWFALETRFGPLVPLPLDYPRNAFLAVFAVLAGFLRVGQTPTKLRWHGFFRKASLSRFSLDGSPLPPFGTCRSSSAVEGSF